MKGKGNLSIIFSAEADDLKRETRRAEEDRLTELLEDLRKDGSDEGLRISAAGLLKKLNRHQEIIALFAEGARRGASSGIWQRYVDILVECNRTDEAIARAREAQRFFPEDLLFRMKEALALPVLYDSVECLERGRKRFAAGLDRLCREIALDTPAQRRQALAALGNHTNVLLGYQGRNDRELQVRYGDLAHRIMAASYPQWATHLKMPSEPGTGPSRVGYISERFRDLSAMRFFLGWMRGHDRERFAVHAWYTGSETDRVTEEVRGICTSFHHYPQARPGALEQVCRSIRLHDLHVLVFLDAGMDPRVTQLASLRLAPIQCKAWDQPITSGLPMMDYAFTPALSEPEGGEEHYSEQLVRLPGVGVCYQKPLIPTPLLRKTRRDFGVREDAVVYLCCQQAFKFLPQNDDVFVRIAQRVPNAQFVFTVMNDAVRSDFLNRLDKAFAAASLRAADYCVMLRELEHLDYWNLHNVGDVFLDTIGWSSGGSIFEAVACKIPVVTLAGESMRGRQGSGILSQLGVTDTVAPDLPGYVEIAVRLAHDRSFHERIVRRMVAAYPLLYSDTRSVAALDDFFVREIRARAGV